MIWHFLQMAEEKSICFCIKATVVCVFISLILLPNIIIHTDTWWSVSEGSSGAVYGCDLFFRFIIPLLHGSIFPEEIESLQLLDDKVSPGHQLLDLLGVCHVFILHES